jgi:arabinofuranosyltransferase
VLGWTHRWTADDAFFNFRVVDHLLAGNGPVFNEGERVEIYTSTLWVAVLAVVHGVLSFVAVEWIAVVLGLTLAVAGLAAATVGARLLHGELSAMALPVGALVFAALPPAWDYATSGLETGLSFAWLGGVFLALVATERFPGRDRPGRRLPNRFDLLAVAIGLGPLVRPDFVVFSAAFFVALLAVQRPASIRSALRPLLLMLALPVAYQVFRMGYFALLVPNTGLAKEAGLSRWGQGFAYAWDSLGTYWLFVPSALLGAWLAFHLPHLARRSRTDVLLVLLPILGGALHLVYVVKVGGDFMHGRLILPGLFAMLMPVAALPLVRHRAAVSLVAAAVAVWAVVAATGLQPPYAGTRNFSDRGFSDEAAVYKLVSDDENPVTVEDHEQPWWAALVADAKQRAESGEAVLTVKEEPEDGPVKEFPARPGVTQPTLLAPCCFGVIGHAAGPDVHIVDYVSLGDPIGSRFRLDERGRPGHEKLVDSAWAIARFSDPARRPPDVAADEKVAAAEQAINCGTLDEVIVAITEPLSLSRFFENLALAPRATTLRFAAQPDAASRELCD